MRRGTLSRSVYRSVQEQRRKNYLDRAVQCVCTKIAYLTYERPKIAIFLSSTPERYTTIRYKFTGLVNWYRFSTSLTIDDDSTSGI